MLSKLHRGMIMDLHNTYVSSNNRLFDNLPDYMSAGSSYKLRVSANGEIIALADLVAKLEHAEHALLLPSCMTCITFLILALCSAGDHVLLARNSYSVTQSLMCDLFVRFGIEVTVFNALDINDLEKSVRKNTKLLFFENPTSDVFEIVDFEIVTAVAQKHSIVTVCDNSWATSFACNPKKWGVDIVVSSMSKTMCGNNNMLMGYVAFDRPYYELFVKIYTLAGFYVSGDQCRSMMTGMLSMEQRIPSSFNVARNLCEFLVKHKKIKAVLYPVMSCSEYHDLWRKYFTGAPGLFGLVLDRDYTVAQLDRMFLHLDRFFIGNNWGGNTSMIKYCGTFRDGSLLRIYCGSDTILKVIASFEKALSFLDDGFEENQEANSPGARYV